MGVFGIIIICAVAIILAVILGNGAVYVFNHIPGKWLTNYGEEPSEELLHPTEQRIKSTPWKYVFTGLFLVLGIYLGVNDWIYAIPTVFAVWLLLEMAIADKKYMVVPDQFILLLLITAIGFIPYIGIKNMLFGAGLGFAIMGVLALLSRIFYKKPGIGGADIKIFVALGLMTGVTGVAVIFVISTLLSVIDIVILLLKKKITLKDKRAMVPYIAIAASFYLVLLKNFSFNITI